MIPLAGSQFPDSHAGLAEAITRGLNAQGIAPQEVLVEGGVFPSVGFLKIDLTGARVARDLRPSHPGAAANEQIVCAKVEIVGAPCFFEETPLQLALRASSATLSLARSSAGDLALILTRAADGEIVVTAQRADLESLAHSVVVAAAAKQGIQIKQTQMELTSRGPRSVGFRAEVTAKMFVMSAKIAISGELDIDDQLNARLSNLACAGEGMIASAANALLKPYFARVQGRVFPLLAFSLGEIKLRDVAIETGETLRICAAFGSGA